MRKLRCREVKSPRSKTVKPLVSLVPESLFFTAMLHCFILPTPSKNVNSRQQDEMPQQETSGAIFSRKNFKRFLVLEQEDEGNCEPLALLKLWVAGRPGSQGPRKEGIAAFGAKPTPGRAVQELPSDDSLRDEDRQG